MWEFVRLSSQEVLFCTQVQSTGHKSLAGGHPEHFTTYYEILRSGQQPSEGKDKAMEEILNQASQVWLKTNAALFKHVLDYETKLEKFLNKTGGWIREQEEHIWRKMYEITGDAGTPLCASLDIMLCLLDTLPLFLANLSYRIHPSYAVLHLKLMPSPGWGFLAWIWHAILSFKNHKKAKDVLKEAIIQSTGGGTVSRASAGPSASTSTEPTQIKKDTNVPPLTSSSMVHSPSKHRHTKSLSPQHSQSDSSSNEESASGQESKGSCSSSSSSSGSSSGSGSGNGSRKGSPARSEASAGMRSAHSQSASIGSIKVLSGEEASRGDDDDDSLYSANKGDVSQGSVSLLDISVSDDEDTCKRKARELAHKSDTDFAVWKDKLISDGTMGLLERDNVVNDYADGGKRRPKNPDFFGPPVTYMEERGVLKPLPSTMNPLGLCHFYPTDPTIVSTLTPPKPPAKADHIKILLLLTKT